MGLWGIDLAPLLSQPDVDVTLKSLSERIQSLISGGESAGPSPTDATSRNVLKMEVDINIKSPEATIRTSCSPPRPPPKTPKRKSPSAQKAQHLVSGPKRAKST
jgi:hypothetical protein